MPEQQISGNQITNHKRGNAFRHAGITSIGVGGVISGGIGTGARITFPASFVPLRGRTQDLTKRWQSLRIGSKFVEVLIKNTDPDLGQNIKVLQQTWEFHEVECGVYEESLNMLQINPVKTYKKDKIGENI